MSYIQFQQECLDCKRKWNAAFGIIGIVQVAAPPEVCPYCQSDRIQKCADGWETTVPCGLHRRAGKVKHEFVTTPIPGTEHEHGSHYGRPCVSSRVVCTCGEVIDESTCYPPSEHDEHGRELMVRHRLDYLESRLEALQAGA